MNTFLIPLSLKNIYLHSVLLSTVITKHLDNVWFICSVHLNSIMIISAVI